MARDTQALQVGLVPEVVASRYPYPSRHDVVHYVARLVTTDLAERITPPNTQSQCDPASGLVGEMERIIAAISVVLSARFVLTRVSADAFTASAIVGWLGWH